jgi:hypothetical protein
LQVASCQLSDATGGFSVVANVRLLIRLQLYARRGSPYRLMALDADGFYVEAAIEVPE